MMLRVRILIILILATLQRVHASDACVSWRNTGGCNPDGPREPHSDLPCAVQVPSGASGFCECSGGLTAKPSTCEDRAPITCATECAVLLANNARSATRSATVSPTGAVDPAAGTKPPTPSPSMPPSMPSALKCEGWRQTHGCDPNGRRDRRGDKACEAEVEPGASGYCECSSGNVRFRIRLE